MRLVDGYGVLTLVLANRIVSELRSIYRFYSVTLRGLRRLVSVNGDDHMYIKKNGESPNIKP